MDFRKSSISGKENKEKAKIAELKISEKLDNSNPLKNTLNFFENNFQNGIFFKIFCLVCLAGVVIINVVFFASYGCVSFAVFPLTFYFFLIVYNSYRFFSCNIDHVYIFRPVSVYFLYACAVLLFLQLANLFFMTTTCFVVFVNYTIVIGIASFLLPVSNKIFFMFQNYQNSYFNTSFSLPMKFILIFLFFYVGFVVVPLLYRDVFLYKNVLFVSFLIIAICYWGGAVGRIFFILLFILMRVLGLKIDIYYKNERRL